MKSVGFPLPTSPGALTRERQLGRRGDLGPPVQEHSCVLPTAREGQEDLGAEALLTGGLVELRLPGVPVEVVAEVGPQLAPLPRVQRVDHRLHRGPLRDHDLPHPAGVEDEELVRRRSPGLTLVEGHHLRTRRQVPPGGEAGRAALLAEEGNDQPPDLRPGLVLGLPSRLGRRVGEEHPLVEPAGDGIPHPLGVVRGRNEQDVPDEASDEVPHDLETSVSVTTTHRRPPRG